MSTIRALLWRLAGVFRRRTGDLDAEMRFHLATVELALALFGRLLVLALDRQHVVVDRVVHLVRPRQGVAQHMECRHRRAANHIKRCCVHTGKGQGHPAFPHCLEDDLRFGEEAGEPVVDIDLAWPVLMPVGL